METRSTAVCVSALLAGLMSLSLGTAGAQTDPICQALGPAVRYGVVATQKLETRIYHRDINTLFMPFPVLDSVCSPTIKVGRLTEFRGDVVAVSPTTPAITFAVMQEKFPCQTNYGYCYDNYCGYGYDEYGGYPCCSVEVWEGHVSTGGGLPDAFRDHLPTLPYGVTFDTTGLHEEVDECRAALAHVPLASAALNLGLLPGEPPTAARPVIDLGDIYVTNEEGDDSYVEIGNDDELTFYRARNVILQGGRLIHYGGYEYQQYGGTLVLNNAVLNVTGRFKVGRGVNVYDYNQSLINVVGKGSGILLQRQTDIRVPIIALERKVRVKAYGGGIEYYWVTGGNIIAKDVRITGTGNFDTYYGMAPWECGYEDDDY